MSAKSKRHLHAVKEMPPHARESLKARGIDEALAASNGLHYVTAEEAQELVGKPLDDGGPSDGIAIPYSSGKEIVRWLRAGIESKCKYKAPLGSTPEFYLPRNTNWNVIAKSRNVEVIFTEGEFKAIVACAAGYSTISIPGVWGWLHDHKPIEGFKHIEWRDRTVVLCFDSDVVKKQDVQKALCALADHLTSLGAVVCVKLLPEEADGSKNGLDDYLARHGEEAFEQLPNIPISDPQFADWGVHPATRELNGALAFVPINGRGTILVESTHPEYPGAKAFDLVKPADLTAQYLNQRHKVGEKANGSPIYKTSYEIWLQDKGRRCADRITFAPDKPPGLDESRVFNLYQGMGVLPVPPDNKHSWRRLQDHIYDVVANANADHAKYILDWMAWCIQHPAERPEVALLFLGGERTGKGIVFRAFTDLHGPHGVQLFQDKQLVGNFNRHLQDKLAIFADESFFAGDHKVANALKGMITEKVRQVEPKFCDSYTVPNFTRLMIASNEEWVVRASPDAARFACFEVSEKRVGQLRYFRAIGQELKNGGLQAMLHDLQHRDLTGFDPRRLPKTPALFNQKRLSFDDITATWYEWLLDGRLPPITQEAALDWPIYVQRVRVMESFADAMTGKYGRKSLETRVGLKLQKLCPGIREERRMYAGHRDRYYVLPHLEQCRSGFESYVKTPIDWTSGGAATAESGQPGQPGGP